MPLPPCVGRDGHAPVYLCLLKCDCTDFLLTDDVEFPPLGPPNRQQSLDLRHSNDLRQSTPPVPPGFESKQASRAGSISESRHSTPTVPPGLTKPPTAVPQDLEISSRPSSRASLKRTTSSQIQPALPLKPTTPSRTGTPTPAKEVRKEEEIETPTRVPKTSERTQAAPVEEQTVKGAEQSKTEEPQQIELQSTKQTARPAAATHAPTAVQPAAKGRAIVETNQTKAVPVTPTKPEAKPDTQRRKAPGKLDIAAATKHETREATTSTSTEADGGSRIQSAVAQTPSTVSKPASPSISSPAAKPAPKTIRVVQTPKAETPPGTTVSTPKELQQAPITKLPSRQPSVGSINLPGTPSSEQVSISDNISMTSTSQSRANSPPPSATPSGKVGSALVKPKTKAQLKRERQERAKALEAEKVEKAKTEEVVSNAIDDEPAQEAILSRKKKAKKEKEPKG